MSLRVKRAEIDVLTLQADTKHQAAASPMSSRFSARRTIALGRSATFNLRKTDPHTSARALCISGKHFGNVARKADQVCSRSVESVEGTRRYLNSADKVDRSTVSTSLEIDRAES